MRCKVTIVCGLALLVTITGCKGEDKPGPGTATAPAPANQAGAAGEFVVPPMDLSKLPLGLEQKLSAARQKVAGRIPDSSGQVVELGAMAYVYGFPEVAVASFKRATVLTPSEPFGWYGLARAYEKTGDKAQAIAAYAELLKMKPDNVPAQARLAALKGEPPPTSQAIDSLERQLLYIGRDIDTVIAAATFQAEQGKGADALRMLEDVRDLDATGAKVAAEIARVQLSKGDLEAAQRELNTAADSPTGKDEPGVKEVQALVYVTKGEPDKAEPLLRELLATAAPGAPYPVGAANTLAWTLATNPARLKPDEAVQLAERANEATGNSQAAILDTLAAAYAAAGRFDDAVKTIQQAIEIAEKDSRQARDIQGFRDRQKLYEAKKPYVSK